MASEVIFRYAGAQFGKFGILVDSFTGSKEGGPLAPAGTVGDMITEECIAQTVKLAEGARFVSRADDKRQLAILSLLQAGFGKEQQFFFGSYPAVLPGSLEACGMSKAPGGESGINNLPGQPI